MTAFHDEEETWTGDWRQQIRRVLDDAGWLTLTAMAQSLPTHTLDDLALCLVGATVTASEVESYLAEEARRAGTLRSFALDLLVRRLRAVPQGWPHERTWRARRPLQAVLIGWQVSTRDPRCEAIMQQIAQHLLGNDDIPSGWQPRGPDDPILDALFSRYWPLGT